MAEAQKVRGQELEKKNGGGMKRDFQGSNGTILWRAVPLLRQLDQVRGEGRKGRTPILEMLGSSDLRDTGW